MFRGPTGFEEDETSADVAQSSSAVGALPSPPKFGGSFEMPTRPTMPSQGAFNAQKRLPPTGFDFDDDQEESIASTSAMPMPTMPTMPSQGGTVTQKRLPPTGFDFGDEDSSDFLPPLPAEELSAPPSPSGTLRGSPMDFTDYFGNQQGSQPQEVSQPAGLAPAIVESTATELVGEIASQSQSESFQPLQGESIGSYFEEEVSVVEELVSEPADFTMHEPAVALEEYQQQAEQMYEREQEANESVWGVAQEWGEHQQEQKQEQMGGGDWFGGEQAQQQWVDQAEEEQRPAEIWDGPPADPVERQHDPWGEDSSEQQPSLGDGWSGDGQQQQQQQQDSQKVWGADGRQDTQDGWGTEEQEGWGEDSQDRQEPEPWFQAIAEENHRPQQQEEQQEEQQYEDDYHQQQQQLRQKEAEQEYEEYQESHRRQQEHEQQQQQQQEQQQEVEQEQEQQPENQEQEQLPGLEEQALPEQYQPQQQDDWTQETLTAETPGFKAQQLPEDEEEMTGDRFVELDSEEQHSNEAEFTREQAMSTLTSDVTEARVASVATDGLEEARSQNCMLQDEVLELRAELENVRSTFAKEQDMDRDQRTERLRMAQSDVDVAKESLEHSEDARRVLEASLEQAEAMLEAARTQQGEAEVQAARLRDQAATSAGAEEVAALRADLAKALERIGHSKTAVKLLNRTKREQQDTIKVSSAACERVEAEMVLLRAEMEERAVGAAVAVEHVAELEAELLASSAKWEEEVRAAKEDVARSTENTNSEAEMVLLRAEMEERAVGAAAAADRVAELEADLVASAAKWEEEVRAVKEGAARDLHESAATAEEKLAVVEGRRDEAVASAVSQQILVETNVEQHRLEVESLQQQLQAAMAAIVAEEAPVVSTEDTVKLRADLMKTLEAFKKAKALAQSFKATTVTQREELEVLRAQLEEMESTAGAVVKAKKTNGDDGWDDWGAEGGGEGDADKKGEVSSELDEVRGELVRAEEARRMLEEFISQGREELLVANTNLTSYKSEVDTLKVELAQATSDNKSILESHEEDMARTALQCKELQTEVHELKTWLAAAATTTTTATTDDEEEASKKEGEDEGETEGDEGDEGEVSEEDADAGTAVASSSKFELDVNAGMGAEQITELPRAMHVKAARVEVLENRVRLLIQGVQERDTFITLQAERLQTALASPRNESVTPDTRPPPIELPQSPTGSPDASLTSFGHFERQITLPRLTDSLPSTPPPSRSASFAQSPRILSNDASPFLAGSQGLHSPNRFSLSLTPMRNMSSASDGGDSLRASTTTPAPTPQRRDSLSTLPEGAHLLGDKLAEALVRLKAYEEEAEGDEKMDENGLLDTLRQLRRKNAKLAKQLEQGGRQGRGNISELALRSPPNGFVTSPSLSPPVEQEGRQELEIAKYEAEQRADELVVELSEIKAKLKSVAAHRDELLAKSGVGIGGTSPRNGTDDGEEDDDSNDDNEGDSGGRAPAEVIKGLRAKLLETTAAFTEAQIRVRHMEARIAMPPPSDESMLAELKAARAHIEKLDTQLKAAKESDGDGDGVSTSSRLEKENVTLYAKLISENKDLRKLVVRAAKRFAGANDDFEIPSPVRGDGDEDGDGDEGTPAWAARLEAALDALVAQAKLGGPLVMNEILAADGQELSYCGVLTQLTIATFLTLLVAITLGVVLEL